MTPCERYAEVQAVWDGLHADRGLADRLGEPTTSAAVFRRVWVSRFEADLRIIAGHVAPDVHEYLTAEVEVLSRLVDALDEQVPVAMHGDPWHENVLLEPERVWLLDWETLSVGEPVIDDATSLWTPAVPKARTGPPMHATTPPAGH